MKIQTIRWKEGRPNQAVEAFLDRRGAAAPGVQKTVRRILADVRRRGDQALAQCAWRYDGVRLRPAAFRVTPREIRDARRRVDAAFRRAVGVARKRIAAFARAGGKRDWFLRDATGAVLGERFVPLDRVGVCVPGAMAPLASTALMTVTLAKTVGVREIVACVPARGTQTLNPHLVYALDAAGATEIYRIGGAQAVAAMAYGTATVRKVQKIVGPGNAYVTEAKRQVFGEVAIDMLAGPSEIAILADGGARPDFVAADLLSQAEHGTGREKALLVTTSAELARAVSREIGKQTETLSRRSAIAKVVRRGVLAAVVDDLDAGMDLCNRFAPEHLELMVANAGKWLRKVRCAGAVFLGPWTPESAGDYVAGPSHVLPTGGTAAMFSGLTADDFVRRSSFMYFPRSGLRRVLPVIECLGRIEGLDAHVRSARMRFGLR